MKTVIASYPAYDVVEAPINSNGIKCLKEGDKLALSGRSYKGYTHSWHYKIGSVVGSAVKDNACPIEALERAKKYNHDLYFIYGLGSCLTAHKRAKEEYIEVSIGDYVYFAGKIFEIMPANNNNLALKEIGSASYFAIAKIDEERQADIEACDA